MSLEEAGPRSSSQMLSSYSNEPATRQSNVNEVNGADKMGTRHLFVTAGNTQRRFERETTSTYQASVVLINLHESPSARCESMPPSLNQVLRCKAFRRCHGSIDRLVDHDTLLVLEF